jgi:Glycosyltransferases, probably involved in cell wall biogenesis
MELIERRLLIEHYLKNNGESKMNYSVLSSVYEKENPDYLKQSIESILNQTIKTDNFVLVIDGPLTDLLENVIKEYMKLYPEVISIVRLSENVGLAMALNEGIKACKNDLIARMDTDDIALPERCELQLNEFERDRSLDIVGSFMDEFVDDPEKIYAIKTVPIEQNDIYEYAKRRCPFNHPTVMYKKYSILSIGGYKSIRRGEDIDLFNRLMFQGYKGKNINKSLIKYRTNDAMLKRRKSWITSKTYILAIYNSWRMGYSKFMDLIIVSILQIGLMLCPISLERWIFINFFRKKVSS